MAKRRANEEGRIDLAAQLKARKITRAGIARSSSLSERIVTTVEKKQMFLFDSAASECRGGPQRGQVADFIVSTGVYLHSGCAAV